MQHSPQERDDAVQRACAVLERLRARAPRVHCITNAVAQNFTANALLALGCVPSMTHSAEEVAGFVSGAQALLVNLGTFDAERRQAAELAVAAACENAIPWVLDPVFVDRSRPRADFARALVGRAPRVMRLNPAEFSALTGADATPDALERYAAGSGTVIGLSGATDIVTNGARLLRIANGHALMSRVTAMGCAASALVAACLAVETDAFRAAAAGLLVIGIAGELAAAEARGPGSFAVAIIDTLAGLDAAALAARARVS